MLVQLTIDTTNAKDVALAANTLGYMTGFLPVPEAPEAPKTAPQSSQPSVATPAAQPSANVLAEPPVQNEAPKTAKAGRKKAEAAVPVATNEIDAQKLDFAAVKAKLQSYSDDARFGLNGVLAILNEYGVQRISALPEARYAEFAKEIDEALAGQANPLA